MIPLSHLFHTSSYPLSSVLSLPSFLRSFFLLTLESSGSCITHAGDADLLRSKLPAIKLFQYQIQISGPTYTWRTFLSLLGTELRPIQCVGVRYLSAYVSKLTESFLATLHHVHEMFKLNRNY